MKNLWRIVVVQNGSCCWFFDIQAEAEAARQAAIAMHLNIVTDDTIAVLPAGEILTSAFEFVDFYDRAIA